MWSPLKEQLTDSLWYDFIWGNSLASGIVFGCFFLFRVIMGALLSSFLVSVSALIGIWPWVLNESWTPTGSEIHLDKVEMWHWHCRDNHILPHPFRSQLTLNSSACWFSKWTRLPTSPPVLKQLQWPPVYFSIVFKILLFTFKSLQSLPLNSKIDSEIPTHPPELSGPPLPPSSRLRQSVSRTF